MKFYNRMLIILVLIAVFAGCGPKPKGDNTVAKLVAESFANQGDGLIRGTTDNMVLFHVSGASVGSSALQSDPDSSNFVPESTTTTITFYGGFGSFIWNDTLKVYEQTPETLPIPFLIPGIVSGSIDPYYAKIGLFNSLDGSGPGVKLDLTNTFSTIHSVFYHREIGATWTNLIFNIQKQVTTITDLTFKDLNDPPAGVTISGTHVVTWTTTSGWGGTGTITFTFDNLSAVYQVVPPSSYNVVYNGDVGVSYSGTINGNAINASGTIHLNGQKTVTVTINDGSVTVDITTGSIH